jgi:tRNA G10  N-methylase Trm11
VDSRDLPYDDNSMDCIVLDPPYIYSPKGTMKESISVGYALNAEKGGELLKNQGAVLKLYLDSAAEARRVLRTGGILILKTKDTIQSGKQFWMHTKLMDCPGFHCEDLFVLTQKTRPAMDPKWGEQKHARKNHSFFIVLRKDVKVNGKTNIG